MNTYPKKKLKNKRQIKDYYTVLTFQVLRILQIDGYKLYIYWPGESDHCAFAGASMCVSVEYPYRRINLSIQQDSINKILSASPTDPLFKSILRSLFHECFHVLVWQFAHIAEKRFVAPRELEEAEENLVDHLANVTFDLVNLCK